MTHPLWPRMNTALNRLELMSETPAANPSPSAGGKPGSKILQAGGVPEREYWLRRWNATPSHRRLEVVEGAERAALPHKTERVVLKVESVQERTARILHTNNEHVSPRELAVRLYGHITVPMIVTARKEAGLDTMTGTPVSTAETPQSRARRMLGSGSSLRVVEAATGIPRSTLHRMRGAA